MRIKNVNVNKIYCPDYYKGIIVNGKILPSDIKKAFKTISHDLYESLH